MHISREEEEEKGKKKKKQFYLIQKGEEKKKRKSVAVKATVQLNESKGLSVMNFSECLSLADNSSR